MLKFTQITYTNIGPFANQTKTVQFGNGKYLIKAPIGSGKSFLYFDGPTYALYKRSGRKMVNNNCKTGKIVMEFENDGIGYKVERDLKQGKSKDSCKSKFWIEGEEIIFKNETDLQGNIEQALPPREVFLATFLLMQDAPNIFELQAQDRLDIFKHIFNLLGIDEGKEILGEKKRDLYSKIKVLQDTSKYDDKLNMFLSKFLSIYNNINGSASPSSQEGDGGGGIELERSSFLGKLSCKDFSFGFIGDEFAGLKKSIEKFDQEFVQLKTQVEEKKKNLEIQKTSKKDFLYKVENLNREVQTLNTKITSFDSQKLEDQKTSKKAFLDKISGVGEFCEDMKQKHSTQITELNNITNINQLQQLVQSLINEGKNLKNKKELKQSQFDLWKQKIEQEKKNQEREKEILEEKVKDLDKRILEEKKELTDFSSNIDKQASFQCEKIDSQCPFIKVINKQTFDNLESQKLKISNRIAELEDSRKNILEEISRMVLLLAKPSLSSSVIPAKAGNQVNMNGSLPTQGGHDAVETDNNPSNQNTQQKTFEQEIEQIDKQMLKIRESLQVLNWKQIDEKYEEYQDLDSKLRKIDNEITQNEKLQKDIETYKQQVSQINGQIQQLDSEIEKTQKKGFLLEEELEGLQKDLDIGTKKANDNIDALKNILEYEKIVEQIRALLSDFKDTQMETKKVQEEFQIMSDLYFVFSKELLLLVLQESIPVLNEIVNSYLAEVVDYQIKMSILQEGEKVSLEIIVIDNLGEREVRALSGGQKVVLKLARMLAVASYMKTSMLFLDETINNLDADSIAGVAEMLSNFVKQHEIDLYVVTHSSHIQGMDIWDGVLEIK